MSLSLQRQSTFNIQHCKQRKNLTSNPNIVDQVTRIAEGDIMQVLHISPTVDTFSHWGVSGEKYSCSEVL